MTIWSKNNLTGEMYSLVMKIKDNWDTKNEGVSFTAYLDAEIVNYKNSATEWLAEDEEEKKSL